MREVVARNPFAKRTGIEPAKLAVIFLARDPGREELDRLVALKPAPEELRVGGRELYVYYPDGMGRSKFNAAVIERTLFLSASICARYLRTATCSAGVFGVSPASSTPGTPSFRPSSSCRLRRCASSACAAVTPADSRRRFPPARHSMRCRPSGRAFQS